MMNSSENEKMVCIPGVVQSGRQIASGMKIKTIQSIIRDFTSDRSSIDLPFIHYSGTIGTLEPQIPILDQLLTQQYAKQYNSFPLKILNCFPGTININIAPYQFKIIDGFKLTNVLWRQANPQKCETFWLIPGAISVKDKCYYCYFYLPDPKGKLKEHQTGASVMEILTQKIPEMARGKNYGQAVFLYFSPKYIKFTNQYNLTMEPQ